MINRIAILAMLAPMASVYDAVEYMKSQYPPYPDTRNKPTLFSTNPSAAEAQDYTDALLEFEEDNPHYLAAKEVWRSQKMELDAVLEEYLREKSNFTSVPQQYQDRVWEHAKQDSEKNNLGLNYEDFYLSLRKLVYIFEVVAPADEREEDCFDGTMKEDISDRMVHD